MLIPCPECERKVSDRAKACPDCGFPVAEDVALRREAERQAASLASRERVGEADCPHCEARGFQTFNRQNEAGESKQMFTWCEHCNHSGRVHLCRDTDGYYAVSLSALESFCAGEINEDAQAVVALGPDYVANHRYPGAGEQQAQVSGSAPDEGDGEAAS